MNKKIVVILLVAAVSAALAVGIVVRLRQAKAEGKNERAPITVQVTPAKSVDWPVQVVYPSDVQALQKTKIVPQDIRGHIKTMYVDKGDDVRAGQRLVDIDCPDQADARQRSVESLHRAEAQLRDAQILSDRLVPMAAGKFVPQEEADDALAKRDAAAAEVERMKASLSESQDTLDFCHIDAPYNGTITARYLDPGNEVEPNLTPVLEMMDTSVVRVMVFVTEDDLRFIHRGLDVFLSVRALPDHAPFHWTLTRVVRSLDPGTRTELVESDIPNPDGLLKPGMYGDLSITIAIHKSATLVPDICVVPQRERDLVLVEKDGKVEQRSVKLGYDDGSFTEILPSQDPAKTVAPGDLLVGAGKDMVSDGSHVVATENDALWDGLDAVLKAAATPPPDAATAPPNKVAASQR